MLFVLRTCVHLPSGIPLIYTEVYSGRTIYNRIIVGYTHSINPGTFIIYSYSKSTKNHNCFIKLFSTTIKLWFSMYNGYSGSTFLATNHLKVLCLTQTILTNAHTQYNKICDTIKALSHVSQTDASSVRRWCSWFHNNNNGLYVGMWWWFQICSNSGRKNSTSFLIARSL